jgi:tetratricopeptide (TPR) repeat protein
VWAFLAPDDLPRALLTDHAGLLPDRLAAAVADRLGFQQTLGTLRRYSLATLTPETVGVHRLVQAVVRHALDSDHTRVGAAAAVGLVLAGFPDQAEDFEAWPMTARLLPHALAVTDHAQALGVDPIATAGLLHQAGRYLWSRAEYTQAKALHQRALSIREAEFGPDHPDTAHSLTNLASVLVDQGDLDGAIPLYERALSIRETRVGADHPDTAHTLHNLANALATQGDLDGARTLQERALAIRETHLGADHPWTATVLNDLGVILRGQGDLHGARTLFERALSIHEARLGADHPETVTSRRNLTAVEAALDDRQ